MLQCRGGRGTERPPSNEAAFRFHLQKQKERCTLNRAEPRIKRRGSKMKKITILFFFFLFFIPFAHATVILDPNDPNFIGYPDGNNAFNAQCNDTNDFFYVYLTKTETVPEETGGKVQCNGENHWYNFQAFYDQWAGTGTFYLLEVLPSVDCTTLNYETCASQNNPQPPTISTSTPPFQFAYCTAVYGGVCMTYAFLSATGTATTSDISILPTMTGGEILISLLLLLCLIAFITYAIIKPLFLIRTTKTIVRHSTNEEGKEELQI